MAISWGVTCYFQIKYYLDSAEYLAARTWNPRYLQRWLWPESFCNSSTSTTKRHQGEWWRHIMASSVYKKSIMSRPLRLLTGVSATSLVLGEAWERIKRPPQEKNRLGCVLINPPSCNILTTSASSLLQKLHDRETRARPEVNRNTTNGREFLPLSASATATSTMNNNSTGYVIAYHERLQGWNCWRCCYAWKQREVNRFQMWWAKMMDIFPRDILPENNNAWKSRVKGLEWTNKHSKKIAPMTIWCRHFWWYVTTIYRSNW